MQKFSSSHYQVFRLTLHCDIKFYLHIILETYWYEGIVLID